MSIEIKTWRDPYDAGFSPTRPKQITLNEGVTILVGCNGAGKTTLLNNIKSELKKQDIPCHLYNNLTESNDSVSKAFYNNNTELGFCLLTSSEGECIKMNIADISTLFDEFLETGFMSTKSNKLKQAFQSLNKSENTDTAEKELTNKRFLLFDAIDSGLSIDSLIEVKEMCKVLLSKAQELNIELYIIISANSYELARQQNCLNVNTGKYITFNDYEEYRKFIINTRKAKEKRIEKQAEWYKKKREKQQKRYEVILEKNTAKIKELEQQLNKMNQQNDSKSLPRMNKWRIESKISDLKREIESERPK